MDSLRNHFLWFLYRRSDTLVRLGIILGVFAAAVLTGWITRRSETLTVLIVAGSIGALAMIIGYRSGRSEYGILGIILSAGLMNFFTLPTGTESRLVISLLIGMALVGLWFLQLFLGRGRSQVKPSPINRPLVTFVAVSIIAYVWSNLLRDPLVILWNSFPFVQLAALAVNILLPLLALYISNRIEEVRWLKWLAWLMISIGAFVITCLLLHIRLNMLFSNGMRGLFSTWVGALALALVLFDASLSNRMRLALLGVVGAFVYYNFIEYAYWLSGWMPLFAALIVLVFLRSKKLFLILALVALAVGLVFNGWLYENIIARNLAEGSDSRLDLWETNLDLIVKHPLFGVGPAGYAVYYISYHPENARSTHNNYFDVLAQTGIVGLAVFAWMMVTFLLTGYRLSRQLAGQHNFEEAFVNAALAGGVGALLGMMLGDWVLPFAYNQTITGFDNASYTWVFLGGMISLYHILQKQRNAP